MLPELKSELKCSEAEELEKKRAESGVAVVEYESDGVKGVKGIRVSKGEERVCGSMKVDREAVMEDNDMGVKKQFPKIPSKDGLRIPISILTSVKLRRKLAES